MKRKRVLWIESGQMLGDVIGSLFDSSEQVDLIRAAPGSSQELLRLVRELRPQIVALDDTLQDEYLRGLLRYMQHTGDLRVVVVGANRNQIEVYQKEQIRVQRPADFFAALQGGSSTGLTPPAGR